MSGPPSQTFVAPSAALLPGALVLGDRFRIVRLLGRGGMGFVYLAEQVSLGRQVALKVLRNDLTLAPGFAERFRREALLLSSIEHAAVVRVIDYGTELDAPVLVMEYVEGETLESILEREAPLSVERCERLLMQLAQGLAAIHAKGIVHRDMKPENVIVTKTVDGFEQARLLDFGIARLVQDEESAKGSVTQAGIVLGTPEYVSPEQGMGQQIDARSDLYSLATILYRALVGKHPFPGPSPREFISQHIHQMPPSLLDAAPHLATFPTLVGAVTACLEKDPAKRPQTAAALFQMATSQPLTLSAPLPPPPSSALRGTGPMISWKAALIAGAVVLALISVAVFVVWNDPVRRARRLVEVNRGSEALQIIEDLGATAQSNWTVQQLKATALHQVGRHDEELKVMGGAPQGATFEELSLEALADDFGHQETPKLRKLLAGFPKANVLPTFQALATKDETDWWAKWGALRFVDLEYAGQGLPLMELYLFALTNRDCGVRRTAATRLVDFRSQDAMPALEKLKALPKKKGEPDCGQAAADAALKQLAKE
ncbi:MAG: serine/threonine protein kinase [Archangium sp.]|nr:serine/threonine protein kinase [Archangium sp.]